MRILICSDGSAQAENAIRFGGSIAAACKAETTMLGIPESPAQGDAIFDSLRRGQALLKDEGVAAEIVIKPGEPIEEIARRAREVQYDLVVIGAVHKGARGPYLKSAKAYTIIRAVEPPVLVVIGDRTTLRRVLIASGGGKYIDKAVEFTGEVARCAGAAVTLFHVLAEPAAGYADLIKFEEDVSLLLGSSSDLGRNLRREKETLERMGLACEVRLRHGRIADEVLQEAVRGECDLVVVGSLPVTGALQNYFLGNITQEIVDRSDRPVLVVRTRREPSGLVRILKGLFARER